MVEKVEGKANLIIKRDGREQKYSPSKLKRAIDWCTQGREALTQDLFASLDVKIHNRMKIEHLWDAVIATAANKISEMYIAWDSVAKRALLLKIYKEVNNYDNYKDVIAQGLQSKVYSSEILSTFSEDEIEELGSFIVKERDFLFTFAGLNMFMEKYAMKYTKTKILELPQHAYLRVAIQLHYNDPKKDRLKNIQKKYDQLSKHQITEATPKMVNSLKPQAQMFSCTLMRPADDSKSINYTANAMGLFSKYGSGLGVDISAIRAGGQVIKGTNGISSGSIPFIKMYQEVVAAYNQGGTRVGAATIYYDWFHSEAPELTMLKDAGGKDDERARKLKYAIKWGRLLSERIIKDESITLFSPNDVEPLLYSCGEEFKEYYERFERLRGIKKRTVSARDFAFNVAKVRAETGNLYVLFKDNVNKQRMGRDFITQGNLCTAEVVLPTEPLKVSEEKLIYDYDRKEYVITQDISGTIALCNLSSINLINWVTLNSKEKHELISTLLLSMDNATKNSYYPVKAGEIFMEQHNPVGVGVSNYAQLIALNKLRWDDEKTKKFTHELFEEIAWYVLYHSALLAKRLGRYKTYEGSNWEKGFLPHELSKLPDRFNYPLKQDWELVRNMIKEYGVRFEYHLAIAPTQCQTKDSKITTNKGVESLEEVMNRLGVDHEGIEADGEPNWYLFKEPLIVDTPFGMQESSKIWYNGLQPTRTIVFEDGFSATFTLNHRLMLSDGTWVFIKDLKEGDDIKQINH